MPIFDYYCALCGKEELYVFGNYEDIVTCSNCNEQMKPKCNCAHFKLIYNNKTQSCGWSFDGYATNRYWDEYKKQRAEGKKVKPCNED